MRKPPASALRRISRHVIISSQYFLLPRYSRHFFPPPPTPLISLLFIILSSILDERGREGEGPVRCRDRSNDNESIIMKGRRKKEMGGVKILLPIPPYSLSSFLPYPFPLLSLLYPFPFSSSISYTPFFPSSLLFLLLFPSLFCILFPLSFPSFPIPLLLLILPS